MFQNCKFCGKKISTTSFLSKNDYSCGECSSYCMTKCPTASSTSASWHKDPCVSCEHNPYKIQHVWDGRKWKKC